MKLDLKCRDTICAPATPQGRSALSIVRVSGPSAIDIKEKIFRSRRGGHNAFVATLGDIIDDSNDAVDEAMCVYFPDSRSFTGEPSFELTLHGNPVITHQVLTLLQRLGCRPAGPGEFSLRAVLNGKLDLTQAESIVDIIDAQSPQGVAVALRNLRGGLEQAISPIRDVVISTLCEIEARLDFPDENIGERHKERLLQDLRKAYDSLSALLLRSQKSDKLMQGYRVVLYGEPNVGKSTLLNALLGEERSIVHESAGTTRDTIEVPWQLDQIPVVLVDVAGIRDAQDIHPVEAIGIERAKKELERADIVLMLQDATQNAALPVHMPSHTNVLRVLTKIDLPHAEETDHDLRVSAKTGEGLDDLIARMKALMCTDLPDAQEVVLTRLRHVELVQKTNDALQVAITAFSDGLSDECVAFELRDAGKRLDELLGKNMNEEVLDLIFSRFCIGK